MERTHLLLHAKNILILVIELMELSRSDQMQRFMHLKLNVNSMKVKV